jgi:hypothetical protein
MGRPLVRAPLSVQKKAGSQAGWALITGGVNAARVDAHRIHHLLNKVMKLVESSPGKEHIYQVAGDIIMAIPSLTNRLEDQLDETSYALACMGKEHLKERLPISRRNQVEVTIEGAPNFSAPMLHNSVERVAERYLQQQRVARRYLERNG